MTVQVETPKETPKTDQKYKIKVGGQELELTYEQLVERAQKGEDYERKTKDLSDKRKALDEETKKLGEWSKIITKIDSDPKLRDTLSKVMTDYESGKSFTSDKTRDKNLKLLDKRIEDAQDPEVRESLKDIRQIISEETEVGSLKNELSSLKEEFAVLRNNTALSMTDRIDKQLSDTVDKYGEIVDKYKSEIRASASRYPNQTVEQLFFYYASPEDRDAALLNKIEKEKKKETKKKEDGSFQPVDTTRTKIEAPRDKRGRVDWNALIGKLKEKGRFQGT